MNGLEGKIAKMVFRIIENSGCLAEEIAENMDKESVGDARVQFCDLIEEMANDEVEDELEESGRESSDEEESFIFNAIKTEIENNKGAINAMIRRAVGKAGKRRWEQEL